MGVPHPVEHPGWFATIVCVVGASIAAAFGDADFAGVILVTGIILYALVRVFTGSENAVAMDGCAGVLARLWLVLWVAWTFVFALVFPKPATSDFIALALPWVGGPVLWNVVRFIIGR